jgi:N-hydroxyarylamine O-acetyltransferase
MCRYHQTSPASSFTQRTVVTIATADGRLTLAGRRFIVTAGGRRNERAVADPGEYGRLLADPFGIHLAADQVARLAAV